MNGREQGQVGSYDSCIEGSTKLPDPKKRPLIDVYCVFYIMYKDDT